MHNFSPALIQLIYHTRQREMLREKQADLLVAAAAATNSGMVENNSEILTEASDKLRDLINEN